MEFPIDYFEPEIRDGYYIPGKMKRYWAVQMEILSDIAMVCEEYGIKWFANYGTLLGAVRHNGFVPWDDDLDICMLRDDYERFLRVANDALPEFYHVINHRTFDYGDNYTRIINTLDICMDDEFLKKFHGVPYSSGIDIFVLDYVCDSEDLDNSRNEIYNNVMGLAVALPFGQVLSDLEPEQAEVIPLIEECCNIKIDYNKDIKHQLYMIGESLAMLFSKDECSRVSNLKDWAVYQSHIYPKEYFSQAIKKEFECGYINIPIEYHEKLTLDYGDYAVPALGGGCHNYPMYENNEQVFFNRYGLENKFSYNYSDKHQPTEVEKGNIDSVLVVLRRMREWEYAYKAIEKMVTPCARIDIIMAPFYDRMADGTFNEKRIDEFSIEESTYKINLLSPDNCELTNQKYDLIITTCGYDEYEQTLSIDESLYTSNLKRYTNRLVYVQPFEAGVNLNPVAKEIKMMEHYVNIPAFGHCHEVYVGSEDTRYNYINYLCSLYGESRRRIWDKKIHVI